MTDLATRRAERAAEGGDLEARAAWLRDRLRTGELDPERAALAAYCGDEAARAVLGWGVGGNGRVYEPDPSRGRLDWRSGRWIPADLMRGCGARPSYGIGSGLLRWGWGAYVRAARAACRELLAMQQRVGLGVDEGARRIVGVAERWTMDDEAGTRTSVDAALQLMGQARAQIQGQHDAYQALASGMGTHDPELLERAVSLCSNAMLVSRVLDAMAAELVPWALEPSPASDT